MSRREIKQFVIGKDISELEVENLILTLANWFRDPRCDRNFEDPVAEAKDVVGQCLNALTKKGEPWKNAPEKLVDRIRIKGMYDIETKEGIPVKSVKSPNAVRRLNHEAKDNDKKMDGMNPLRQSFDIEAYKREKEQELLTHYPDLDTPVMLPHVRRLISLYSQQEIIDKDLEFCTQATKRQDLLATLETLNKTIDSVLKILDIHPDSVRKKIKESSDGTLGDLVALLDGDEGFKSREKIWALQAALQLWSMTVRPNGRGDGPQLSDWELWHMTRSVPFSFECACKRRYPSLIQGFTPKQLKDFLVKEGVLIERPVFPTLISHEDLKGLETFIDNIPEVIEPENGEAV